MSVGTYATEQLDFYITSDGTCVPEKLYSTDELCLDKLKVMVAAEGIILLHGLLHLSALSRDDEKALTFALSAIVGSESQLDVSYSYQHDNTFNALRVDFHIEVPTNLVGIDGTDPDNLYPAYQAVATLISDGVNFGTFLHKMEHYASSHSDENLSIMNHGFVELESMREGVLRDRHGLTGAPSPFYYELPTQAPSRRNLNTPRPTTEWEAINSGGGASGYAPSSSSSHHSDSGSGTDWSSQMFIAAGVVCVGLVFMFLLRRNSGASPDLLVAGGSGGGGSRRSSRQYKELSTESSHERGVTSGNEDEIEEEDEESGENSIKAILLAAASRQSASVDDDNDDDDCSGSGSDSNDSDEEDGDIAIGSYSGKTAGKKSSGDYKPPRKTSRSSRSRSKR